MVVLCPSFALNCSKISSLIIHRIVIIISCFVLVFALALPVAAAPAYTDRGFIVEPMTLDLDSLVLTTHGSSQIYYASVPLDDGFEVVDGVSSVSVWFGDYCYNSGVIYSDTSSRGDDVCYIGNVALLTLSSTGSSLPFCCKLDVLSTSNFYISLTPEFYETLQEEYSGFVTFAVQPVYPSTPSGFISSIFDVLSLLGGFVIGLLNSVTGLFWSVSGSGDIKLTLLGALSLVALGISVVFLLIRVIRNFLRFRS